MFFINSVVDVLNCCDEFDAASERYSVASIAAAALKAENLILLNEF